MRASTGPAPMKPQDIVVLLSIALRERGTWKAKDLAADLVISPAEIGYSLKRSIQSGLLSEDRELMSKGFLDMLYHAVRYVFPARPGAEVRGVPTAHSAPPLKQTIVSGPLFVWPDPMGKVRGAAIRPLYPTVPQAAAKNKELYALLALTDALRTGRVRERELAMKELRERIR